MTQCRELHTRKTTPTTRPTHGVQNENTNTIKNTVELPMVHGDPTCKFKTTLDHKIRTKCTLPADAPNYVSTLTVRMVNASHKMGRGVVVTPKCLQATDS
jgi:hypothetical protein